MPGHWAGEAVYEPFPPSPLCQVDVALAHPQQVAEVDAGAEIDADGSGQALHGHVGSVLAQVVGEEVLYRHAPVHLRVVIQHAVEGGTQGLHDAEAGATQQATGHSVGEYDATHNTDSFGPLLWRLGLADGIDGVAVQYPGHVHTEHLEHHHRRDKSAQPATGPQRGEPEQPPPVDRVVHELRFAGHIPRRYVVSAKVGRSPRHADAVEVLDALGHVLEDGQQLPHGGHSALELARQVGDFLCEVRADGAIFQHLLDDVGLGVAMLFAHRNNERIHVQHAPLAREVSDFPVRLEQRPGGGNHADRATRFVLHPSRQYRQAHHGGLRHVEYPVRRGAEKAVEADGRSAPLQRTHVPMGCVLLQPQLQLVGYLTNAQHVVVADRRLIVVGLLQLVERLQRLADFVHGGEVADGVGRSGYVVSVTAYHVGPAHALDAFALHA